MNQMKMITKFFLFFLLRCENIICEKLNYLKGNLSADFNNYKNENIYNYKFDEFYYTNQIAKNYVWTTVPIVFLILGTISNTLSIIVFLRTDMKKHSSFVYFAILNIINLALIYVTFIRVIMEFNFNTDIRIINIFTCKLHVFLTYMLGHLSSIILSTVSVDRVISVIFLNKARIWCTPRIAIFVTICLIILNFSMSSHFLFFESAYIEKTNYTILITGRNSFVQCQPRQGTAYGDFIEIAWKIIDLSFYAIIPWCIMTVCSIIIIIRIAEQSKKFHHKTRKESIAMLKKDSKQNQQVPKKEKKLSTINNSDNKRNFASSREKKFSNRTRKMALMLIPVNVMFILLLSPVCLAMYFYKKLEYDKLTLAIVELLAMANYTFNFIIYFVTSSKFREEFYKFLNETYLKCKTFRQPAF